jgi:hypothetical protein
VTFHSFGRHSFGRHMFLWWKTLLIVISCFLLQGWFTGLVIAVLFSHTGALPINDTNHGDKIHIFPKLTSPWFKFKNPETEYTCPNVDKKFNFTIYLREYKCRDWEEIICMDSVSVGRVFFCIPKSTSCSIGNSFYATTASAMQWHIVIHLCVLCVYVCVLYTLYSELKNLLVKNHKSNFNQTWQDWSLGEGLPKLLREFHFIQKSGYHGNQKEL